MTVRLAKSVTPPDSRVPTSNAGSTSLTCALVNNMPDGAFEATERQYLGLLEESSGSDIVEVRRFTMAGVPRAGETSRRVEEDYTPFSEIYLDPPDCLIVTGSNPIEAHIEDERYWADLVELLLWARVHVATTMLSCLSAHAALAIYDGIARVRLPGKCTGVFSQHVETKRPITEGLESEIVLPHSRWNTVPREAIEQVGYEVDIHSAETGWGVASRNEGGRQLVLVQGHPEYDPSSLLREYRRDAGRYVRHERDDVPYLPYHCVSPDDWESLERLHRAIIEGARDVETLEAFPFDEVGARAPWTWHPTASRFFANWLASVNHGEE